MTTLKQTPSSVSMNPTLSNPIIPGGAISVPVASINASPVAINYTPYYIGGTIAVLVILYLIFRKK